MEQEMKDMYEALGISSQVLEFGNKIEEALRERFAQIDKRAEYNQLKVIHAMQKNRVDVACFQYASGYGYNDKLSIQSLRWSVLRLPAEPMRWLWHWLPIYDLEMCCYLLRESLMIL